MLSSPAGIPKPYSQAKNALHHTKKGERSCRQTPSPPTTIPLIPLLPLLPYDLLVPPHPSDDDPIPTQLHIDRTLKKLQTAIEKDVEQIAYTGEQPDLRKTRCLLAYAAATRYTHQCLNRNEVTG